MAITIIVEDGTVVANANSFVSLADARTKAEALGITISADDAVANSQLTQSYNQLIRSYERRLQGRRVNKSQTGIFPRYDVLNEYTQYYVESNEIPNEVINAQLQYAHSINGGADMHRTADDQEVKRFKLDNVMEEEYKEGSSKRTTPHMPSVGEWLQPFMTGNRLHKESIGFL